MYYHQKYFTVLNKLLTILYDSGDYDGVRKAAEKGLQIEPGHTEMYHWLFSAYNKMNLPKSAKDIMKVAMKCMSEEEYADFLKQLENNE